MGASWHNVLRPGAGSGVASLGNRGRRCAPLKRVATRWVRSCLAKSRGRVLRTGAHGAWGGMETPGTLEVARIAGVIVPGVSETPCVEATPCVDETPCVSGVFASVPECVLPSTPCVKGAPQPETARVCEPPRGVRETPRVSAPAGVSGVVCVSEARRVSERPCVRRTACVRSLYAREMSVGMREHAAASPRASLNVNLMECSLGIVTRRCAWVAWRRRL